MRGELNADLQNSLESEVDATPKQVVLKESDRTKFDIAQVNGITILFPPSPCPDLAPSSSFLLVGILVPHSKVYNESITRFSASGFDRFHFFSLSAFLILVLPIECLLRSFSLQTIIIIVLNIIIIIFHAKQAATRLLLAYST